MSSSQGAISTAIHIDNASHDLDAPSHSQAKMDSDSNTQRGDRKHNKRKFSLRSTEVPESCGGMQAGSQNDAYHTGTVRIENPREAESETRGGDVHAFHHPSDEAAEKFRARHLDIPAPSHESESSARLGSSTSAITQPKAEKLHAKAFDEILPPEVSNANISEQESEKDAIIKQQDQKIEQLFGLLSSLQNQVAALTQNASQNPATQPSATSEAASVAEAKRPPVSARCHKNSDRASDLKELAEGLINPGIPQTKPSRKKISQKTMRLKREKSGCCTDEFVFAPFISSFIGWVISEIQVLRPKWLKCFLVTFAITAFA